MILLASVAIMVLFTGALLLCTAWYTALRWCKTGLGGAEDWGDVVAVVLTVAGGAGFTAYGAMLLLSTLR